MATVTLSHKAAIGLSSNPARNSSCCPLIPLESRVTHPSFHRMVNSSSARTRLSGVSAKRNEMSVPPKMREYLVYQPERGEGFSVELEAGKCQFEWFNASRGVPAENGRLEFKDGAQQFKAPFEGDAVLYLKVK